MAATNGNPAAGAAAPGQMPGLNGSQKEAVAQIAAQDASRGAPVHTFDTNAAPQDKAAASKSGFGKVFGAPKQLGRGVMNVGRGAVDAGAGVGRGVVSGVGSGAGAIVGGATNVVGGVADGVGAVGRGAISGVGAVGKGAIGGANAVTGHVHGQARNMLGNMPGMGALKDDPKGSARAVAIDTSTSDAPAPTVSLEDAKKASEAAKKDEEDIPGNIPKTVLPGIPTWMGEGFGWKEVAGIEGRGSSDLKTKEQLSILQNYVSDQYYGAWYVNAGIIVVAVLATRLTAALRFGWAWVFIILAFCATAYSLSIKRTRERARDDIQRELVKTRLITETESADWLNGFLDRFWLIYEPVLSATIVQSVDAALVANTPGFLDSIRMTTFTLGNKAPRIDYVRTFPKTADDVVAMDWAISFTPNDVQDITPIEAKNRVNPKIVLTIRLGKGMVSTGMPILLEDLSFSGKMRIKLKLMTAFPHIQKVEMSFIEKPNFDYVLKPIGGETFGFDINSIPGLAPFIRDQVHANLGPMMYDPNVFTLDLEQMLSGNPLDAAIGVLKITVHDARGLKSTKLGGGAPDPYVALSLGAKPPVARTKTIDSTTTPSWNETQFVLVNSLADVLNFNIFDFNEHTKDDHIGTVSQELQGFEQDESQEGLSGRVIQGGKDRGELRYDINYYPTIQPEKKEDGTFEPLPDIPTGIARLNVHQAKDFDRTGDVNAFASVYLGKSPECVYSTDVVKKNASPAWDGHTEYICADKNASVVTVIVKDKKSGATLGRSTIRLADIIAAKEKGEDWFPLQGSRKGKIRLSATFKPVSMPGAIDGAASYVPPIGILRLHVKKAIDVKNVELTGKSDPYVRVLLGGKTLGRTETKDGTLNPVWDEILYIPVHSLRERLTLELMDYQNIGKDRTLGTINLEVGAFAAENPGNVEFPYASLGPQALAERIYVDKDKQYKGQLVLDVDFKPAMSLRGGVSFEPKAPNPVQEVAQAKITEIKDTPATAAASATPTGPAVATVTTTTAANGVAPAAVNAVNGTATAAANGAATAAAAVNGAAPAAALANAPGDTSAPTPPPGAGAPDVPKKVAPVDGAATNGDDKAPETAAEDPEVGVELSDAQLLQYQSGILVFQVIEGQLARKGALEIMFDDGYYPTYTSERARGNHVKWDQVGEGFVKELDFGRTNLRINADPEDDQPEIVGQLSLDTKDFLEQTLNKVATFTLTQPGGGSRSTVTFSTRYIPVNIVLEQRETVNNQGILRVNVLGAKNLMAADRGGKSDPNVTFSLNGKKVFKSETIKKTVNPVWNETFETAVPSRVASQFEFLVSDWNTVGSSDPLGGGVIDLNRLEPFQATNAELPVILDGKQHGTIQLQLLFTPQFVTVTRERTNTFVSGTGRVVTNVGTAAIGAPVAVGKGVVGGVGKVVSAPGRLFSKKNKERTPSQSISNQEAQFIAAGGAAYGEPPQGYAVGAQPPAPGQALQAGQVSAPAGVVAQGVPTGEAATTLPADMASSPQEPGTLTVTVVGVKDIRPSGNNVPKALVSVRCGGKQYKTDHKKGTENEFNESFAFHVAPGTNNLQLSVLDHHSFGKDESLGEAQVDIWRHIQPAVPTADVFVELNDGSGAVKLRLDWQPGVTSASGSRLVRSRSRTASISSRTTAEVTPSKSKFGSK